METADCTCALMNTRCIRITTTVHPCVYKEKNRFLWEGVVPVSPAGMPLLNY